MAIVENVRMDGDCRECYHGWVLGMAIVENVRMGGCQGW